MDSTRQQKVSRLLQKDLGQILQLAQSNIAPGKMLSVTEVRVSPDMSFAKVFVSVFPSEKSDETMLALQSHVKEIRHSLAQRIRHQLRIVPEIAFVLDQTADYARHIDELLNNC